MRFVFLSIILALPLYFFHDQYSEAQQLVCPQRDIDQLTEATDRNSEDPSINSDGRYVAFRSSADLIGENPTLETQVFLFDRVTRNLSQITNDPELPSLGPSINGDGDYIAFQSSANITGGNINPVTQIYVYDVINDQFSQLTADLVRNSSQPSINSHATHIAFQSSADFTGQNGDNSVEIFLVTISDNTIIQITADPNPGFNIQSSRPSISGDANIITFESESDITGQNPDEMFQVFYYVVNTGVTVQVSIDTGGTSASQPAISEDGQFIVYRSKQNINNGNPDNNTEIFLYEIATGQNTQITFTTSEQSAQNPSINGDGSFLTYESDANLNIPVTDRSIWLYDVANAQFIQVTNVPNDASEHSRIAADALSIAFESRANITGDNPPDPFREVYVAECGIPTSVPTLSEWGLIAMAGVLGVIGLLVIRRRTLVT